MIIKSFRWILRYASIVALVVAVVLLGVYLALRFYLLPNIHQHKDEIATRISNVAQQKITIGDIRATWDKLHPVIATSNITIYDAQNRPALEFEHIVATLSWKSLSSLQPRLTDLSIVSPQLIIRRETTGDVFVAGIPLSGKSNPDLANWLLRQGQINIKNASVIWQDDFRKAPPLSLNQLDFRIDRPLLSRLTGQHEFSLHAIPSIGSTHPIEISGRFYGNDVSKTSDWHGDINAKLVDADLSVWKQWLDYPFDLQSGFGTASLDMHFNENRIDRIKSDVALRDVSSRLKQQNKLLTLNRLIGQLNLQQTKNTSTFEAKNIQLTTSNGLDIRQGNVRYAHALVNGKPVSNITLKLDSIRLESLREFASYTPIPEKHLVQLENMAPSGLLNKLNVGWKGDDTRTLSYNINTQFSDLSLKADGTIPGFSKLSGSIQADENRGTLRLDSKQALLDLKDILRWPVPLDVAKGNISWRQENGRMIVSTREFSLANAHISGKLNASYTHGDNAKEDMLDVEGNFGKGDAKYAPFYYPIILGKPTLHWLDTSILSGRAEDIKLIIKGKLGDFPYVNAQNQLDPKLGMFRVTAKISDVEMEYGTGWPNVQGLGLDLLFEGKRMELNSFAGHIYRNKIIKSKTVIPQLDADWPMLLISSEVHGPVEDGVRYVNESPVKLVTQGFTDNMKTAGQGKLLLDLKIPMQDLEAAKYKGIYTITNGMIYADKDNGLPQLNNINGTLNFTESSLTATNVRTEALGGPAQFSLKAGTDKAIRISANGHVTDSGIRQAIDHPLAKKLQGGADWSGELVVKKPLANLTIRSNLNGLAIQLPAPIGKSADQAMPFSLAKKQTGEGRDSIQIGYGSTVSGILIRQLLPEKTLIEHGDIAINIPTQTPVGNGLAIRGKLDELDADAWIEALTGDTHNKEDALSITKADFYIQKLHLYGRQLNDLHLVAKPNLDNIDMHITSKEVDGDVSWHAEGNGKIIARLKQLTIPSAQNNGDNIAVYKEIRRQDKAYPALDVIAENFQIGEKQLGKLTLNAYESQDDWVIQKLNITNSDSTLNADGTWQNWTRRPNTNIKFNLVTDNIGKTLKRFGQPDMVKGGEAEMTGQLQWPGSPHEFDAGALSGNFTLDAKKGQILKVQPGVGRLLGLLSLQSLPRRLTLDFRDLFSEGFAFDKIGATAQINNGVLRSDNFLMDGPAAEAYIKGETNLKAETQNLNVKVIPHVSDTLSLAALAGGPIAGAAAFVAQKILKDPFNKIASTEYVIGGTWNNPQEVKLDKGEQGPNHSPMQ